MTLVIVDGMNAMIRSYFAYPDLRSPSGAPSGAAFGVVSRVRDAVARFSPCRVVVAWEGGRSAWRRAVYPGYKVRPLNVGLDLTDCFAQRSVVQDELLPPFGVGQVRVDGVEADDVVAALAAETYGPVVVVSTDRDFWQLVSDRVSVLHGADASRNVTAASFAAVTGKSGPGEWLAYRVVNGDASDAIPRVHGLSGEKRFAVVYDVLCEMGYDGDAVEFFLGQAAVGVGAATQALGSRYDRRLLERLEERVVEAWGDLGRNTLLMDLGFALRMLPKTVGAVSAEVRWGHWDEGAAERVCSRLNFGTFVRDWTRVATLFRGAA